MQLNWTFLELEVKVSKSGYSRLDRIPEVSKINVIALQLDGCALH